MTFILIIQGRFCQMISRHQTRVGDVFLAFGLFLLFRELGMLNISDINANVSQMLTSAGSTVTIFGHSYPTIKVAAVMLVLGAMGKSAQIPLHSWLADAMAGPTPSQPKYNSTKLSASTSNNILATNRFI